MEVEPRGCCHSQCGQCMSVRQCHFVRNTPYTIFFSGVTLVTISRIWGFWLTFLTSANNTFIYEANNAVSFPNTVLQVPSTRTHPPTGTMKPGCYFLAWKKRQHSNEENDSTSLPVFFINMANICYPPNICYPLSSSLPRYHLDLFHGAVTGA